MSGLDPQIYRQMLVHGPRTRLQWLLFVLAWLPSQLYAGLVRLRASLYAGGFFPSFRAAVPVLAVGNLTVGGTGKTPVADLLVKRLHARGVRVAIVSRGYGGRFRGRVARVDGDGGPPVLSAVECGDEPWLLARRNPQTLVFIARKRRFGLVAAQQAGAEVIVLDDGFQHLAVQRDLNLLLLDGRAPFGNGRLLPAGPLREPRRAVARADLILLTRSDGHLPAGLVPSVPVLHARHRLADCLLGLDGRTIAWSDLHGKNGVAFAGIADPEGFFSLLRQQGVALVDTIPLADHQRYDAEVLKRLRQSCENAEFLLTTEKDGAKLVAADLPIVCYQVPLEIDITDSAPLDAALDVLIGRRQHDPAEAAS
ncbi:MAG: tetraacyldisaccharide 4'-kinase [Desulfuromonadales bacterium]|nr:tetraacyldisaccharide 4'-kinase [Desulfuromonadales bacterium]